MSKSTAEVVLLIAWIAAGACLMIGSCFWNSAGLWFIAVFILSYAGARTFYRNFE